MRAGRFREDLFYRLIGRAAAPAAAARARATTSRCSSSTSSSTGALQPRADGSAARARACRARRWPRCRAYRWPGNVRELVNVVERAVVVLRHELIERVGPARLRAQRGARATPASRAMAPAATRRGRARLGQASRSVAPAVAADARRAARVGRHVQGREGALGRDVRARLHHSTLRKNNGNISHAARDADIDRKYFRKLMKQVRHRCGGPR